MWRGVNGEVGTSTTMMVIGALFGAIMFAFGVYMTLFTNYWKVGVPWALFWGAFTAYDLYRATRARERRLTAGA